MQTTIHPASWVLRRQRSELCGDVL